MADPRRSSEAVRSSGGCHLRRPKRAASTGPPHLHLAPCFPAKPVAPSGVIVSLAVSAARRAFPSHSGLATSTSHATAISGWQERRRSTDLRARTIHHPQPQSHACPGDALRIVLPPTSFFPRHKPRLDSHPVASGPPRSQHLNAADMAFSLLLLPLLPLLALTPTAAAQGLLSTPGLPACATSCPILIQATQACGGTATTSQQIWSCFCQSGYLTTLHTSPNGICDGVCTAASEDQQLMQWYVGNCGSDFGASEHADTSGGAGQTGGTTVLVVTSTQAAGSTVVVPTQSATAGVSSSSNSGQSGFGGQNAETGSWWSGHWVRPRRFACSAPREY